MAMENNAVVDALALRNSGDYNNGNCNNGMWGAEMMMMMWPMFFFMMMWGGGFGGFGGFGGGWGGNNGALTRAEMTEGFNNQSVLNKLDGINNGLCDGFYAQNTTMLQGFGSVNQNINNLGYQAQQCCCETNRNIDALRYETAKNTCDIIEAGRMDTQRIIDTFTQNTIQELRDQKSAYELQLSQQAQNATLIAALRPTPIPAYITCSPYTASGYGYGNGYYGGGCGYGGSCGCN